MRGRIWILVWIVLSATAAFATYKLLTRDGRSPYEKLEDESRGAAHFRYTTATEKAHFVRRYCGYAVKSKGQLQSCETQDARRLYNTAENEYRWLYAVAEIGYCGPGSGPLCRPGRRPPRRSFEREPKTRTQLRATGDLSKRGRPV